MGRVDTLRQIRMEALLRTVQINPIPKLMLAPSKLTAGSAADDMGRPASRVQAPRGGARESADG